MTNFAQNLGNLLLADEIIAAAPSLGTFFTGVSTAGADPAKWILLVTQLNANLGAAQIPALAAAEGQLSQNFLSVLANIAAKAQATVASGGATPPV